MEGAIQAEMPSTGSCRSIHTPAPYKRSTKKAPPPPPRMPPRSLSVGDDCAIDERLEGSVDLRVILPDCSVVELTVDRRTALLDLLVQVTAANKISPGDHLLYTQPTVPALDSTGTLALYPPNTPVGSLDASTLYVLPKQQQVEAAIPRPSGRAMPFEPSVRLTVNLPRRQRAVLRLSPTATLADVKRRICQNYALDHASHRLVDPRTPGSQLLDLNTTLTTYGHTEISIVSQMELNQSSQEFLPPAYSIKSGKGSRSTSGILEYFKIGSKKHSSRKEENLERRPSEDLESRASSLPPSRKTSFNHNEVTPSARPGKKKAPPPPPPLPSSPISTPSPPPILPASEALPSSPPPKTHSRNNSDTSSGYHEASVLSDSPENSSGGSGTIESPTPSESVIVASVPRPIGHSPSSLSSSRTSVGGTKKRKAPPPPTKALPSPEECPASPTTHNEASLSSTLQTSGSENASSPMQQPTLETGTALENVVSSSPPKHSEPEVEKSPQKEPMENAFPLPVQRCSSLPDLVEMSPELEEEAKEKALEDEAPSDRPTEGISFIPIDGTLADKEATAEVEASEAPWEEEIPAPPSPFRSTSIEDVDSPPLPVSPPPPIEHFLPSFSVHEDEVSVAKSSTTLAPDDPSATDAVDLGEENILPIMPKHRHLENFSIGTYKKLEEDIFAPTSSVEASSGEPVSATPSFSRKVKQNGELLSSLGAEKLNSTTVGSRPLSSSKETSSLKNNEKATEPPVATDQKEYATSSMQKGSVLKQSTQTPQERAILFNASAQKAEEKSEPAPKPAPATLPSPKGEGIRESHTSLPEGQDWQEHIRQFKELERQYHAWKEQLARNQLLLEEKVKNDEKCQTLPRPPRPSSLHIESQGSSATLGRRPPRPKSQAIVTIGSWEKRTQTIKVVDNDIVSSAKPPDDVDSRRRHFASNRGVSGFKKPKPPPPPKRSQSLEALATDGSTTPTESVKSLPPSKQFFILREAIKDESRQPSATTSTIKINHSHAQAKTATPVPNPIRGSSLEEIRMESRHPNGSIPRATPRNQCGLNGDLVTPTDSTHRSFSDSKAALMVELKKRLTPPPSSENRSFTPPPPSQSKAPIKLDPRAELMLEIRNFAGKQALRQVSAPNGCPP